MFEKFLKRSSWTDIVISIIFVLFGVLLIAKPDQTLSAISREKHCTPNAVRSSVISIRIGILYFRNKR